MPDNYPPGVTGREPQLTGEWPCRNCGATLPEEPDCPQCDGGALHPNRKGDWECECGYTADGDVCPDGCYEPDWDDIAEQRAEARADYLAGRDEW